MKVLSVILSFTVISFCLASCKSIHEITAIPTDSYRIRGAKYLALDTAKQKLNLSKYIKVNVEQADSNLLFMPEEKQFTPMTLPLADIPSLNLFRHTFDIDILTVPFKIRPSTSGFPEQLNSNFSAALYLGRRRDYYAVKTSENQGYRKTNIKGVGIGYGGFIGLGSVSMNPYVTKNAIDYEYDGLVIDGGLAGIYDAKRFNLGIAIGVDLLLDKNRNSWIYQGKPWFGILLGLNLN